MIEILLQFTSISLILYGIYKWVTLYNNYFEQRGVPYLKPHFFFGHTGKIFLGRCSPYDFHSELYNSFPSEKILGLFDFRKPFLSVRDPDIAKQLVVKDFDHFEDHRLFFDAKFDKLFGNSLIMLRGEKWRDMRATLSPAFTGSKMRQMLELVVDCADEMSKYFLKKTNGGNNLQYEMKDMFSRYTNDVIASTSFGIKVNSLENVNNEFWVTGNNLVKFNSKSKILKLILLKLAPSVAEALDIEFVDKRDSKFLRSMVADTMLARKKEGIFRPDMINILMQLKKGNEILELSQDDNSTDDGFATVQESSIGKRIVKRKWNDDELVAQCFIFFAAGFDTSSTLLSFLSYELAVNPTIQQKLYEEILQTHQILNGKQLQYDVLQKMKYMDMVISETLRLWPPLPATDRVCVKNYMYDDGNIRFEIEKGTVLFIPILGFHHDPKYFPNPSKFDPERFSDENKDNIDPGTYLPFGIGPRNCIGSRLALMEAKAVVYYLILNFRFEINEKTQIPLLLKSGFNVASEKGIYLTLAPRNK